MKPTLERWPVVVLRGLAQVAFAETATAGILVLATTAVLTPWGALGAAVGALAGTIAGRVRNGLSEPEWEAGLSGTNPAIVGILWGIAFAAGEADTGVLVLVLLSCVGIEQMVRPLFRRIRLPVLSAPAMATAYVVAWVYSMFGESFWQVPAVLPFGDASIWAAVLFAGAAMATKSPVAVLQVAVLSAAAALVSGWAMGTGALGPVGLWAFAVAPAAFGMHGVFLAGSAAGGWAGLLAGALGAVIWALWIASPLAAVAPPLLVPFILATWAVMGLVLWAKGPLIFEPGLWSAAAEVRRAHARGAPVVALTGAGISTASGIPDYVSGSWLHPGIPVSAYSFERFLASSHCRREYWSACCDFRRATESARPNRAHEALARMERRGWLETTITQNVDGLHQDAGVRSVIELHGRITHVNCLSCGWTGDWPPSGIWLRYDLHCPVCSGFLKPAVIAMGENIPPATWRVAHEAAERCGVMIVVGSQMAVSSAVELLSTARRAGATIVVVSTGPLAACITPDDIVVAHKAEDALPALAVLLDCPV